MASLPAKRLLLILYLWTSFWSIITCFHLQSEDTNEQLLNTIQSYMRPEINACENFYDYSCGNWGKANENVTNFLEIDVITNLDHAYNLELEELFQNGIKGQKPATKFVYDKLKIFYKSCIELNDYNVSHLVEAIKPWQEEEWPKRGDSLKSQNEWNIWTTLGRMAKYGFNEIFLPGDLRLENNGLYVWDLELYEPNWSVAGAITYPYYDGENEELITMAQRIYDLLEELAQLSKKHTKDEAKELSFKEFQRELPHIDLAAYIWERLGIKDGEKFMITVKSVAYYQQLTELIKRTSDNLLINLLRDSFVYHFRGEMPSDAWHRSCVHTLRKLIPLALDFLYNEEVYATVKTDTNKVIESVYHAVKTKFQQIIQEHSNDLSSEEMQMLKEKLDHMQLNIGNLAQNAKDELYLKYFDPWQLKENDLFKVRLNMKSCAPMCRHAFTTAFNYIGIPFAYIRYPMIHSRFHALFLYAELGNTLGHELMHGFDTDGVTYDSSGSTWPLRIYNKTSFAQGLECLRQEYTTNINEKLADFSGFRLAYESYFHISYDASHDSPTLRVSQIVSNSPDFEEIFACPAKEVMKNRIEKCKLCTRYACDVAKGDYHYNDGDGDASDKDKAQQGHVDGW
uniref:Peptidase M13 C-terminal domain-containing protein n=1 Tax=Stomoxys calcitrans TaxID=35570 RepID=A0A1I8Q7C8_STOCA